MVVWFVGFLASSFLGAVSDLVRNKGGATGLVVGVCTPCGAVRWTALAVFRA